MSDPDNKLKRLRELAKGQHDEFDDFDELSELFIDLDEWLSDGNALPSAWGFAVPPLVLRMEGYK